VLIPYYKAIILDDVSRVTPIFQIIPIFVLGMSYLFLGESLSQGQILGFVLILTGSFFVSVEKVDAGIFKIRKAFWWAILTCFMWAVPSVMFKFAAIDLDFWDAMAYDFAGVGIGAAVLAFFYRKEFFGQIGKASANTWLVIIANEIIYFTGLLCASYAIYAGSVSLAAVLNGFVPVFCLALGIILTKWYPHIVKEDISKNVIGLKIAAAILMLFGLWIIGAG